MPGQIVTAAEEHVGTAGVLVLRFPARAPCSGVPHANKDISRRERGAEISTLLAAPKNIPGRWTSFWKRFLASYWAALSVLLSPSACTKSANATRRSTHP